MPDGNWLTPRQMNARYVRQRLKYMREETSDDDMNVVASCHNSILNTKVKMMKNVIYQVKLDNFIRAEMEQFGQLHLRILAPQHGPVRRTNGISIIETFK